MHYFKLVKTLPKDMKEYKHEHEHTHNIFPNGDITSFVWDDANEEENHQIFWNCLLKTNESLPLNPFKDGILQTHI